MAELEQRIQERQRETIQAIDASGTLQLGKLLPKKLGVTLPMYLGYSKEVSTPQFDPLSPDIEMAEQQGLSEERQNNAQTVNQLKSIASRTSKSTRSSARAVHADRNRDRGGAGAGGRRGDGKGGRTAAKTAEPWTRMSTWDLHVAAVLPGVADQLAAVVPDAAAAQDSAC